jgi:hypothetical protein
MIGVYLTSHDDANFYRRLGWLVVRYGWRSDYECFSASFRCCDQGAPL